MEYKKEIKINIEKGNNFFYIISEISFYKNLCKCSLKTQSIKQQFHVFNDKIKLNPGEISFSIYRLNTVEN